MDLKSPGHQVFFRCVEDCFEPIMLTDRRGLMIYVNPAWTLTYGYSHEEAIGETPRLLRSEFQDETFYKKMWEQIVNPRIGFWRGEVVNRAKDGHLVPVLLTITPYREASGEISGYMGIAVDLTDQKRMEQQILRQDRLASIGMLAGGLAHEIGNPLGVIRGRAEMLMTQLQSQSVDEGTLKSFEVILRQIDRISGLIRSLLRVSSVPEEILLRETHLDSVVAEVSLLMIQNCRKANIELRTHDLEFLVLTEPSHLQQILLNMVINATHAIEDQIAKGPSPLLANANETHFIDISAKRQVAADGQKTIAISVRDSGCGIPPQNLSKLFQPFFTTKAAGVGTGMGLAVVSKLIEEMKGKVFAESEGAGYGATFTLVLQEP